MGPSVPRALVPEERRGFLLEVAGFAAKAPSYSFVTVLQLVAGSLPSRDGQSQLFPQLGEPREANTSWWGQPVAQMPAAAPVPVHRVA